MYFIEFHTFILILLAFLPVSQQKNQGENGRHSRAIISNNIINYDDCIALSQNCNQVTDSLELLGCVTNTIKSKKKQVSNKCSHKAWVNVALLSDFNYLHSLLEKLCAQEQVISKCFADPKSQKSLSCVVHNKPSIQNGNCMATIEQIELLLFTDWQLINNFIQKCRFDIESNFCGRINTSPNELSQVDTLKCLQPFEKNLNTECKKEVDYLNSIKYDSLEIDKVVFAVCENERIKYCRDEMPESSYLFKCLWRFRYESGMTTLCREHLVNQQRLIARNYKTSRGLAKSCKEDIRNNRCRKGVSDDKDVRLAQILLCLESVLRQNIKIAEDCQNEMRDHRKMLMEDFRLSPELMHNCANDITTFCNGIETGGKTIHCLMEHAKTRKRKDKVIAPECKRSLQILMEETNPGEDWRVDPILRKACQPVVNRACSDLVGGEGRVMNCLLEKLGTALMTEDCENALVQIQYFVSRDFKLDVQLFRACKDDAIITCNANSNWADEQNTQRNLLILPCLYNYAYNRELSVNLKPECVDEVRRVMRQRAISVDLLPEIEDFCIDDLAGLCYEKFGKGDEILCLQTKLNELSPKCKVAVSNFTEIQSGHIELNPVVNMNCQSVMRKHCLVQINSGKDEGEIMECLITHKNDPDVKAEQKCRAAVEHYQLISLKNYRFTRKFKNACRSYVVRFCPLAQTKNQVILCLSEIIRNNTIMDKKHMISKECRSQIRSQLFQQRENIDFNPDLKEMCRVEIDRFCPNIPHGESAIIECLQTANTLTGACRKAMFIIRKQEFTDNAVDYNLITTCNEMIGLYCHNTDASQILECLKVQRQRANFDEKCKIIVVNRMIEQNSDYRFNPKLQKSCKMDIKKFCTEIIAKEPQDVELEGKVLQCLKGKFRESLLTKTCEDELADVLKEQALNYRLDPLLSRLCDSEIKTLCSSSDSSITNSDGEVEECLKNALLHHKIISESCKQEVVQIIQETQVDIGADPLLEKACALDLLKYCIQLDKGNGRHLKCLKIILNDSSRKLERECEKELSNRLEMYKYVAAIKVPEDIGEIYNQVYSSPSRKYFLLVAMSMVGLIFIFGMFCGRMSRRAMYMKKK